MPTCPACQSENRPGARFCDACGTPLSGRAPERRKLATLVFCDMTGSTALGERLDPESVREIMLGYFDEMRTAIEHHGGTVEKFAGDAVMAVFGVPTAHEDDALRAVRAAREMLDRLDGLNDGLERRYGTRIGLRIGVNTGEVVAGDVTLRESMVTGDAVNVAARLEQAADAGDVLLGETTYALVRDAVEAEPLEPFRPRGKSDDMHPYRLVRVLENGAPRRHSSSPLVGRDADVRALAGLFDAMLSTGTARGALVVGEPGIGKSRLAAAFLTGAAEQARLLSARCLPYGEGITYSPLAQALRQAAGITAEHDRRAARELLASRVVAAGPDADAILPPLEQLLGLSDGLASPEEIAWAARRALEELARERPLVLLVDDLQWAEPPLAELLARLAARGGGPVFVLCLARPEIEASPPGIVPVLRLGPLADEDAAALVERLLAARGLDPAQRDPLLAAAGGNPLFLEELVSFLGEGGTPSSDLPPGLDALLAARLDTLSEAQRAALECAAVEGEIFGQEAVLALAAPLAAAELERTLADLGTAGFVRAVGSGLAGGSYRFRHLLVRDAAYRSTPKRRRAELHRRFAAWLEESLGDRLVESAEVVGFHLEQSWRLSADLGMPDEGADATRTRAAELLGVAARRSLARGDASAALAVFTRAADLAPTPAARLTLSLERGVAAREAGAFATAESTLSAVRDEARASGSVVVAARADVELAQVLIETRPEGIVSAERETALGALATFEAAGDESGQAAALLLLAQERWVALHCAEMEALLERALVHAERSQEERLVAGVLVHLARAVLFGPRPAGEAAARCEQLLATAQGLGPTVEAKISMMLAVLEAAQGRGERARELSAASTALLEELAPGPTVGRARLYAGFGALISGESERAERELRAARDVLERFGERGVASSVLALLARTLVELGAAGEAERVARRALDWAHERDVATQAYAHAALGRSLAARGRSAEAAREAREALSVSRDSDFLIQLADVQLDLAVVLEACDEAAEARAAGREALALYRAKGNVLGVARAAALTGD